MKNTYQAPQCNVIYCAAEDILTLSGRLASLAFEETPNTKYPGSSGWKAY